MNKKIVISLGGSVIIPDKINKKFLLKFRKLLLNFKNYKFIVICGAGALKKMMKINSEFLTEKEKDLIGIDATRLNALVVSSLFLNKKTEIPTSIKEIVNKSNKERIVVCGGTKPGHTTDYVSAVIAKLVNACCLINISNVKGIYNKNPKTNKNAKLIPKLSFKELNKMFGKIKRKPGQKVIFDAKATKFIAKNKIKTYFIGSSIPNLKNLIEGKKFLGTEILN